MKSAKYFVGAGVVFVLLVGLFVSQINRTHEALALMSEAQAATIQAENVMQFPVSFTFVRPGNKPTVMFAAVKFSHYDHQTMACTTCHHTWDGSGQVEACSTEGCHDDMTSRGEVNSYFHAFHTRQSETSCIGCHRKRTLEGESNLPTSPCSNNVCHAKENRAQ